MIRPLAYAGFAFMLVLTAVSLLGVWAAAAVAAAAFCGLLTFVLLRRSNEFVKKATVLPLVCAVAIFACAYFLIWQHLMISPAYALDGREAEITAKITDQPEQKDGRFVYLLETDSLKAAGGPGRLKLRVVSREKLYAEPFDSIDMTARLYIPGQNDESRRYYSGQGVTLGAVILGDYTVTPAEHRPFYYYVIGVREGIGASIDRLLPGEAGGLCKALLLGDESGMTQKSVNDFQTAGIVHLFSVSGFHVSLIGGIIFMLLLFLRVPKRLAAVFSGAGVFLFMALAGFVPTANRSGVMMLIYFAGIAVSKKADSLNSLGAAVILLLLANPLAVYDYGLQLSVWSACALIVLASPITGFLRSKAAPLKKHLPAPLKRSIDYACSAFGVSFAASIGTLPILVLYFKQVVWLSPVANLLAIFPSEIAMICAAVAAALSAVPVLSFLAMPFAFLAGLASKYLLVITDILAKVPYARLPANEDFVTVWLGVTALLAAVAVLRRKSGPVIRVAALVSAVALLSGVFSFQIMNRGVTEVSVLNAGDGLCVCATRDGHALLISAGGDSSAYYAVRDKLGEKGITSIDLMLIPGVNSKTASEARGIAEDYAVKSAVIPDEGDLYRQLYGRAGEVVSARDYSAELWNDVKIEYRKTRQNSGFYLNVAGTSFFMQCSRGKTEDLPDYFYGADVYIAMRIKDENRASSPFVVISADSADNGRALKFYNSGKALLYTCEQGNVNFYTAGGGKYSVKREAA